MIRGRTLAAVASLLCCLALAMAGCGSGSSSSGTTAKPTTEARTTKDVPSTQSQAAGDSSIEEFGAAAAGSEKAAVTVAVGRFLGAMADQDYADMCAELAVANREQLQAFSQGKGAGGCAAALKTLLNPAVAKEARLAAAAPVTSVRIKGDSAFALFTPQGGSPSYLVVKREGDSWKSISVTPGTPLAPSASP
jgi:hypothetical protein